MSQLAVLLKESWALVDEQADDFANLFFSRVFLADPQLRDLFPADMAAQRRRLVETLVTIISTVDDPERFDEYVHAFGQEHRRFQLSEPHYSIVGAALLDSLRIYSGERWSIEYDQAWRDLYDAVAIRAVAGALHDATAAPYVHAEVIAHERRCGDIAVLTCRPLVPVPFLPGQYVAVESRHLPEHWRYYSIANAPRVDGTLDFHIRAADDGWVSASLVRRLWVGEMLRLSQPMGTMTLDRTSTRDIVCVAGGTGLAPIKAIVEELARFEQARWVHLFVGARDRSRLYDLRALLHLADRLPWLSLVTACSEDPGFPGEQGHITDVVERYGPWPDHDFFVSGPPAMVRATLGSLSRMRVPHAQIRYDPIPAPRDSFSAVIGNLGSGSAVKRHLHRHDS